MSEKCLKKSQYTALLFFSEKIRVRVRVLLRASFRVGYRVRVRLGIGLGLGAKPYLKNTIKKQQQENYANFLRKKLEKTEKI